MGTSEGTSTGKPRRRTSLWIAIAVIVVIIIIAAIIATTYRPAPPAFTAAISITSQAVTQGTPITFSVVNNNSNVKYVLWYTGDGKVTNGSASITYIYNTPGTYLVYAVIFSTTGQNVSTQNSMYQIKVIPKISEDLAPNIAVPVITFNLTRNPNAPVVNVTQTLYLYGGYLEAPTGTNVTIIQYIWNFGNGQTKAVAANSSTLAPVENPVSTTYSSPGLYPVSLTIVTQNNFTKETYNLTVINTVAAQSTNKLFSVFKYRGVVPSPGVINVAEVVPGGPYSFDPQVDYESVGFEVISNIFMTLVAYNGSATDKFIPYAAAFLPTVENGGISNNYTVYNFTIRPGLKFSNGDPLTAYDVWYSIIRAMLFNGGSPGTADWIITTKALLPNATPFVPLMSSPNDTATFNAIMHAVTYSNKTNTVAFHLGKPLPPTNLFQFLADPLGAGIIDAKYLQSIGAGITFTPKGFYEYQFKGNEGNYTTQMQFNPPGAGPFMIGTYVPGQSITLVPNPYYQGVPDIPKVNYTVVINWVKDPETALLMFQSGQADIVTGLPTYDFPIVKSMQAQGQASIYFFPTLSIFFWNFNLDIYKNGTYYGSQYHIPEYYFTNLYIRKAFAFAWNYTNYINNILGNLKYGGDFGFNYCGIIPKGMVYYVPPDQLQGCPPWNGDLQQAKQFLIQSGMYNVSVNFPVIVPAGDPIDFTAAQIWAQAIHSIDPNIVMVPVYQEFATTIGLMVPGQDPMPLYLLGWIADYPYPSDYVDAMYLENGTYPAANNWFVSLLNKTGHPDQAKLYDQLNKLIIQADSATDPNVAAQLYKQVEQIAVQLYMFVYEVQSNAFWIIKPYIHPYKNDISYQENPMIGGALDSLYYWWSKG